MADHADKAPADALLTSLKTGGKKKMSVDIFREKGLNREKEIDNGRDE